MNLVVLYLTHPGRQRPTFVPSGINEQHAQVARPTARYSLARELAWDTLLPASP